MRQEQEKITADDLQTALDLASHSELQRCRDTLDLFLSVAKIGFQAEADGLLRQLQNTATVNPHQEYERRKAALPLMSCEAYQAACRRIADELGI